MGINKDHCSELFGSGQTIYSVDFKAQHISSTGVPWDRPALADIPEEMMFRAGGKLLDFEFKICRFGSEGGYIVNGKYKQEEVNGPSQPSWALNQTPWIRLSVFHFCLAQTDISHIKLLAAKPGLPILP